MDPVERIDRSTAFAGAKVKGVDAQDMNKPTPCSEFDVRALLNHMMGNLRMLTRAARDEKPERPQGEQFGSNPGEDYEEGRRELLEAISSPGVFDRDWQMPFATMSGQVMGTIAFMEHLTHGWDVAKATNQDTTMPPDLVADCMQVVQPMDELIRTPGVCGPRIPVPDSASTQDKFVAFLGRTP